MQGPETTTDQRISEAHVQIAAILEALNQDAREAVLELLYDTICHQCGGTWNGNGQPVEHAKRCRCIIWDD